MRALLEVLRLLLAAAPWAMARGALLSLLVLLMGAALLGLSGWFITAAGAAGLAGIGIAFDVFRPSAGVRALALGRTAARYGERVLTHDATLRALAALRVELLRRRLLLGARALARLRSETALTRIVADVDALDGLVLRLVLPALAALLVHAVAFLALGLLAGWPVAWAVLAGYLPLATLVLWRLARRSAAPSREAEAQLQALRRGAIDLLRDREALVVTGGLPAREQELLDIDRQARVAAHRLDREDRRAALSLALLVSGVTGIVIVVAATRVAHGETTAAAAAIGPFVALALAEVLAPLRRGCAELGRITDAAARVTATPAPESPSQPDADPPDDPDDGDRPVLQVRHPKITLHLDAGEALALTGPSGAGKTTLLMRIAGLHDEAGGDVTLLGRPLDAWREAALRERVAMVPQRSALMAGTVRENLALAGDASDEAMWTALETVELDAAIGERGGLTLVLGEGGAGLSGGQARRLSLARALLRQPTLLLLDEPTEGLDDAQAARILDRLRRALPRAAILATLHRGAGHRIFDRVHALRG